MTHSNVQFQVDPASVPSIPSWMEEVAAMAHILSQTGLISAIEDHVQFARARFGRYDTIDFVLVLFSYALSGEPTIAAFYDRLAPFVPVFLALFDRQRLPSRSALSRFLAALDEQTVEALRTQFLHDLLERATPFSSLCGLWDHCDQQYVVIDVDGTRQVARQRALPQLPTLPDAQRRFAQVAAPGYTGRKRGEVVRTRTTLLQSHTHHFLGTFGGSGNGDLRGGLQRACLLATTYAAKHQLPASQILIRLDGGYGDTVVVCDLLAMGLGVLVRSRDYALLGRPEVLAVLSLPPSARCTHPESGEMRDLYDCPSIHLLPGKPRVRVLIATHQATDDSPKVGQQRNGLVYELFVSTLLAPAFTANDLLDLYRHRGSFETVLADEDVEQDPDRWCSRTRLQDRNFGKSSRNGSGIFAWNWDKTALPLPFAPPSLPPRANPRHPTKHRSPANPSQRACRPWPTNLRRPTKRCMAPPMGTIMLYPRVSRLRVSSPSGWDPALPSRACAHAGRKPTRTGELRAGVVCGPSGGLSSLPAACAVSKTSHLQSPAGECGVLASGIPSSYEPEPSQASSSPRLFSRSLA